MFRNVRVSALGVTVLSISSAGRLTPVPVKGDEAEEIAFRADSPTAGLSSLYRSQSVYREMIS